LSRLSSVGITARVNDEPIVVNRPRPILTDRRSRARRTTGSGIAIAFVMMVIGVSATGFLALSAGQGERAPNLARVQYTAHDPIIIYSEADLVSSDGVTGGTGTAEDPFVISGWEITTDEIGGCIFLWRTTSHYVIRDCYIHTPNAVCIEIQEAPNGTIENCLIDEGNIGIFVTGCPNTNVTGNTVMNTEELGICVAGSEWVNVTGNTATNNENFGFALEFVGHTAFTNNFATGNNGTGVDVFNVANLTLTGNNVSENDKGLFVAYVDNTVVSGNNITSNTGCGLNITGSTDVTIHHNNFIGNGVQADQDNASTGIAWDAGYPSGGNFWSDYAGVDAFAGPDQDIPGSDGLGDTPQVISAIATDRYPLMLGYLPPVPEFGVQATILASALVAIWAVVRSRRDSLLD